MPDRELVLHHAHSETLHPDWELLQMFGAKERHQGLVVGLYVEPQAY